MMEGEVFERDGIISSVWKDFKTSFPGFIHRVKGAIELADGGFDHDFRYADGADEAFIGQRVQYLLERVWDSLRFGYRP